MPKAIIDEIKTLCQEKNAIILAHNYQPTEIIVLADILGDSLQLSIEAARSEAEIIVFCGVRFMAETAAILNTKAKVLLPAETAGCPMADMITAEQLREYRRQHPDTVVVCYVNSTAEVKAESDICCTSSNAVKVLLSIPEDKRILFVPDQNLGRWAGRQAGREVELWNGYCPVHHWGFTSLQVKNLRKKYPEHRLLAHPECDEDIVDNADAVMSTSGMVAEAETHDKLIIATEKGLTDYLSKLHPEKSIIPLSPRAICRNMKKTTLHNVLDALRYEQHHITVEPEIAAGAKKSLQRMMELIS
ncbi:MAG: quinolinate synthase NadA [Candidatus Cloacimonetes bacterium]|nr:quinolinate synthase NadA [Candidatus Cloacimonadota bacterium]